MSILIWIAIGIAVYAITFKNDFDSENMEKAGAFSLAVCAILFIGGLLISILNTLKVG